MNDHFEKELKTSDFDFHLPEHLIAQEPTEKRGDSRLLVLDRLTGKCTHDFLGNIPEYIPRNALVVMNNSRVRKARIFGTSETGGIVEFLLIGPDGDPGVPEGFRWKALVSKAKKQRIGKNYTFPQGITGQIIGQYPEGVRLLAFNEPVDDKYLDIHGHIPLPPYIQRADSSLDSDRYQTVYNETTGSVAAPTAGLHFTQELLDKMDSMGIERAMVTLHVGLGTFLPVRAEVVQEHRMHEEVYSISPEAASQINNALAQKRPILAIGTTSVRTLESAYTPETGQVASGSSSTSIFIYPGYEFRVVSTLFTNFHTPQSTLLMLVSAFAGRDKILDAYNQAIQQEYRFFSYGDGMLIL